MSYFSGSPSGEMTWAAYSSGMTKSLLNKNLAGPSSITPSSSVIGAEMKMSKVGNQTNSQDPQAVNSRVFVGNLNTYYCTKTDVERMFQRYGRLAGISMHKGYAFVQFTNPFDARGACLGEDGRTILGQTLDVNMVSEPKPHQTGRKRQNVAKTGNDWDYYYDSYYRSRSSFAGGGPRGVLPAKRPRLLPGRPAPPSPTIHGHYKPSPPRICHPSLDQIKTYSNPDILICGNCREMFSELHELLEHKKDFCKLRFTCKCSALNGREEGEAAMVLLCVQCKDGFDSAWDLMVHVQAAHMVNIYEMGLRKDESPEKNSTDNARSSQEKDSAELTVNLVEARVDSPDNGVKQNGSLSPELHTALIMKIKEEPYSPHETDVQSSDAVIQEMDSDTLILLGDKPKQRGD